MQLQLKLGGLLFIRSFYKMLLPMQCLMLFVFSLVISVSIEPWVAHKVIMSHGSVLYVVLCNICQVLTSIECGLDKP